MATDFPIEDVVDVIIAIADRSVSTRDFGTPLILSAHNLYTDRARTYTSTAAVAADGFSTSSNVYKMANAMFAGNFKPTNIVVGRRILTDYRCTFDVANDTTYTVSVKVSDGATTFDKALSFVSDATATDVEIATGLASAIETDGDIGTLVVATESTGVLVVAPTVLATNLLSVGGVTTNITTTETSPETVTTALTAVLTETSNFFFVTSDSHDDTDLQNLAAWAESNKRIYPTSSQNTDIWTSATTDILSVLGGFSYNNTLLIAIEAADKEFPEASLVGEWAGLRPGSSTLHAKTLKGVTQTSLSTTEVGFITAKNGNSYVSRGGSGFFQDGVMVSGRFADIARGSLWLEARLEERIFGEIKRLSDLGLKIPYTDAGVSIITSVMGQTLDEAVQIQFLSGYQIFPPFVADIAANDKASRLLPDLPFTATLAGAIQKVVVRGFVSV